MPHNSDLQSVRGDQLTLAGSGKWHRLFYYNKQIHYFHTLIFIILVGYKTIDAETTLIKILCY